MPASGSESSGFGQLDERIQRWIWLQQWTTLRDAQEQAIPALIEADRDVIIAAATAAGKTEAAFFPILTHLLRTPKRGCVLYISPLKALINDQWERLSGLCEELDITVTPWHGDVAASKKQKFTKQPEGILLITPESLEAMFVNRGTSVPGMFAELRFIVVDELHAFIGSERGKQLQSLMHRTELAIRRRVPRVGLSATLGDMSLAAGFLRPADAAAVHLINAGSGNAELKIRLNGYIVPAAQKTESTEDKEAEDIQVGIGAHAIAAHLYPALRGSNNLVFPNSRQQVETYTDLLRRRCEQDAVPNEFWPHHGNLSKEIREETERALKDGSRPATAICTTTLELGIDIGAVKTVAQIGPPPSVASLRQRLGRSGRRGEAAILRAYCLEPEVTSKSGFSDRIHEGLLQTTAMIRLLLKGWFEPPRPNGLHASTLVQQILSVIAERGGIKAPALWSMLVEHGPFANIERQDFTALLRHLGQLDLIIQDDTGLLLHGALGEKRVNHYEFYSAFISEVEFSIECNGKILGSMPCDRPLAPQQGIIFAGRRWRVMDIDTEAKRIVVTPDKGGAPPAFDGGGRGMVHDEVRKEMRAILAGNDEVRFLDDTAKRLLNDAREYYRLAQLDQRGLLDYGSLVLLLTWRGNLTNDTLALLLMHEGLKASNEGVAIEIKGADEEQILRALRSIAASEGPTSEELLVKAKNLVVEKWDAALPDGLLKKSFAGAALDVAAARKVSSILSLHTESSIWV